MNVQIEEQWLPVAGYEALYLISSTGRVQGLKSKKILKQFPDKQGYLHVSLCKDGKARHIGIHRLVTLTWHGFPPPDKPYACHEDDDHLNNTPDNLYWGTPTQNCADAKKHGHSNVGERNRGAKLTEVQVREIIKLRLEGFSAKTIHTSEKYPVSLERIQEISSGRAWKHVYDELKPTTSVLLMKQPKLISGGLFVDDRGALSYFNDMNFFGIKRMYSITHTAIDTIRAWHYHDYEGKYVFVSSGTFLVGAVNPKTDGVSSFVLSDRQPKILWIPPGHANGFKNLTVEGTILFFSTSTLKESADDDTRIPWDSWDIWKPDYR